MRTLYCYVKFELQCCERLRWQKNTVAPNADPWVEQIITSRVHAAGICVLDFEVWGAILVEAGDLALVEGVLGEVLREAEEDGLALLSAAVA
jgi:hypothetical protein